MLEIEARFGGRDVRDLVAESYARHGTLRKVARELGCSHSVIFDVIDIFGGEYLRGLRFPEREEAETP